MSNQSITQNSTTFKHGPKPVIGLVGGIGAGKSTAAKCFATRGGFVINADALGHEALQQPDVIRHVVDLWGETVRKPDGTLDRREIGRIVFGYPTERNKLEGVVFPYITARCEEAVIQAMGKPDVKFVVVDAAVLFEAGWERNIDRIVYVDAPREIRLARLATRSGWSNDDLTGREAAQLPAETKMARADEIIVNDAGTIELQAQVDRLLKQWKLLDVEPQPTPTGGAVVG
ncbi:MAG: dephospho-CoA kinase [Planctomycetaceae bacterium]|nr:dephospho-CoA kinase [Planctomycetaceae bacterium]